MEEPEQHIGQAQDSSAPGPAEEGITWGLMQGTLLETLEHHHFEILCHQQSVPVTVTGV